MKINKISLSGYRGATSLVDVEFDTSKSLALIFGENGTGKSTIVDAFDFICNQSIGSLKCYRIGGKKENYLPSINAKKSNLCVSLTSGQNTWKAILGSNGAVVTPASGCPDARILRRQEILDLIEAAPNDRYKAVKNFISVPNYDKSENSLNESIKTIKKKYEEESNALAQAKINLDNLWKSEGSPGSDAQSWATSELAKDVTLLSLKNKDIDTIIKSFPLIDRSHVSLRTARLEYDKSINEVERLENEKHESERIQVNKNIELLSLLRQSRNYILARKHENTCPVCEKAITPDSLLKRIDERIKDMNELEGIVSRKQDAVKNNEIKKTLLEAAQKEYIDNVKVVCNNIIDSKSSITNIINLDATTATQFINSTNHDDTIITIADTLYSTIKGNNSALLLSREADQKTINLRNAVNNCCELINEKSDSSIHNNNLLVKMRAVQAIIAKERKDYIEEILLKIAISVEEIYTKIHPDEQIGKVRFYLKEKTSGSLEFDACFYGEQECPPQAYYSESHLDTLGICIFLALSRYYKTDSTIVILDDVLTSVDERHVSRFMSILHDESKLYNQMIVTTHYRPWRDRYRWAKGPSSNVQLIELGPWSLQNGLFLGAFKTAMEELENYINDPIFDRQASASKAGIILESILDFITLKYRCSLPRNMHNEYTLGDLVGGVESKLGKVMKIIMNDGGSKTESTLKPLIDDATSAQWIRNCVGCHFNSLGSHISDNEIKDFCNKVLQLSNILICPSCKTFPTRRPSGSYWECKCGKIELHPLVTPGADLSRAILDEE